MKNFLRENHYLILGSLMGILATIGNGRFSTGEMVIIIFAGLVADDFAKKLNI